METVIVILILLLVVLGGAGVYYLYFKKDTPAKGEVRDVPVNASVVAIKNVSTADGPRKQVTVLVDEDFFTENSVLPFNFELEAEVPEDDGMEELERFRDPSTPESERMEIAESLRSRGYTVRYKPLNADGGADAGGDGSEGDGEGGSDGVSIGEETDRYVLMGIINDPYKSDQMKSAARKRLEELGPETVATESVVDVPEYGGEFMDPEHPSIPLDPQPHASQGEGREEEEEEEEEEGKGGSEPAGSGGSAPYDDPLAGFEGGKPEPSAVKPAEAAPAPATTESQAPVPPKAESPAPAGRVLIDASQPIDFTFTEDYDDEEDSVNAVKLMRFVAAAFKERMIAPELVEFLQRRLNLRVNPGFWTEEDYKRANTRVVVYERNLEMTDMQLDELIKFTRFTVATNEANRAAEEAAEEERIRKAAEAEAAAVAAAAASPEVEPAKPVENAAPASESDAVESQAGSGDGSVGDGGLVDGGAGEAGVPQETAVQTQGADASGNPTEQEAPEQPVTVAPEPATAAEPVPEAVVEEPAPIIPEPAKPAPRPVPKARPKKVPTRPVSSFFDSFGGRNDLMWKRLGRDGEE